MVPFKLKVFSLEVIDCLNFSKDFEFRERPWFSLKLKAKDHYFAISAWPASDLCPCPFMKQGHGILPTKCYFTGCNTRYLVPGLQHCCSATDSLTHAEGKGFCGISRWRQEAGCSPGLSSYNRLLLVHLPRRGQSYFVCVTHSRHRVWLIPWSPAQLPGRKGRERWHPLTINRKRCKPGFLGWTDSGNEDVDRPQPHTVLSSRQPERSIWMSPEVTLSSKAAKLPQRNFQT